MSRLIALAPAVVGGLYGLYLAYNPACWVFAILVAATVLALAGLALGRSLIAVDPLVWRWGIEAWALFLPAATALATASGFWLERHGPAWITWPPGWLREERSDLVKAAVAVMAAACGALIAGDVKDKNPFWAAGQFRMAVYGLGGESALGGHRKRWEAAQSDLADENRIRGWGFKARRQRAEILQADRVSTKPRPPWRKGFQP